MLHNPTRRKENAIDAEALMPTQTFVERTTRQIHSWNGLHRTNRIPIHRFATGPFPGQFAEFDELGITWSLRKDGPLAGVQPFLQLTSQIAERIGDYCKPARVFVAASLQRVFHAQ